jgi:hypothetical protein
VCASRHVATFGKHKLTPKKRGGNQTWKSTPDRANWQIKIHLLCLNQHSIKPIKTRSTCLIISWTRGRWWPRRTLPVQLKIRVSTFIKQNCDFIYFFLFVFFVLSYLCQWKKYYVNQLYTIILWFLLIIQMYIVLLIDIVGVLIDNKAFVCLFVTWQ